MHSLLETAAEEHMVRLRGITQRAADQAASDARFKELQHVEEVSVMLRKPLPKYCQIKRHAWLM